MGVRLLELVAWRDRGARRDVRAVDALKFCHSALWRALFGRQAKDLEQSNTVRKGGGGGGGGTGERRWGSLFPRRRPPTPLAPTAPAPPPQAEDEYMISDADLYVNRFISVPKDMGSLQCGAFVAGAVRGALAGEGFPARVTAHAVAGKPGAPARTTILVKFEPGVMAREAAAAAAAAARGGGG